MSQNIQYSLVNPLTNQSTYLENDVIDFIVTIPQGMQMRPGSLRINSRVVVRCDTGAGLANVIPTDKVYVNGNTGAHAFFNNFNIEFLGGTQETITEYGRYVSAKTEGSKFYLDSVQDMASVAELKSMSCTTSANNTNYLALIGDPVDFPFAGSVPFSIKPHICVNLSTMPIPSSKIPTFKIKCQLEPAYKILSCDNPLVTALGYSMQELNVTYILEPETYKGEVLMEKVMVQANNTVVGSLANLQSVSAGPFSKMFMTFLDSTHLNRSNSFTYDYFRNELLDNITRLEFTVNSVDVTYSYPLLSNDEILYNYLLCFTERGLDKDSISLAKLRDANLKSGFGIGTKFFYSIPMESSVSTDIVMSQAPANPIRVYTFYISALSV